MIHPTALVDNRSEIEKDVVIGPYAHVGPNCKLASGVKVGMHSIIEKNTEVGENTEIFPYVYIGGAPQDLGFKGEDTYIKIGKNNTLREFVTVHRATVKDDRVTRIGDNNFIMAYCHIAHDCKLENGIIMANSVQLAGHVHIGDFAVLSGLIGVHQRVNIGSMAMVAALSRIGKDVPAFCTVYNDELMGLNVVGLRRRGTKPEVRAELKKAYNIFTDKSLLKTQAEEQLKSLVQYPEIEIFVKSLEHSNRGIIRKG